MIPGKPEASRLLLMPLAHEAGGTEFHPGGKRWTSKSDPEWKELAQWITSARALTCLLALLMALPLAAQSRRPVIVQTNAAGDNIHLIDPATNKVVGEIGGIEVNARRCGRARRQPLLHHQRSRAHPRRRRRPHAEGRPAVPLSGRPNNLAIGRDGRRVYVAIVAGAWCRGRHRHGRRCSCLKTIPTKGGIHNTFVTPDGAYVVAGSIVGRKLTVIDTKTDEPVWSMSFDNGVRPIGFETRPDGSTRRMFVQISDFHGFYVVDFDQRREVGRVTLPELPKDQQNWDTLQGSPSHGIGVTPDGKTLWVCSKVNHAVYAYSMPDLKLLGGVSVGHHPDWLTFTPDSTRVYVANAGSNSVSVVDVATLKEVTRVPVGQVPKRNVTAVLP